MRRQKTRRALLAIAMASLALALAGSAHAQDASDRDERSPPEERQVDPATGRVCRPLCAEDMSPCDPPAMKASEGRCSSPTAGMVGG